MARIDLSDWVDFSLPLPRCVLIECGLSYGIEHDPELEDEDGYWDSFQSYLKEQPPKALSDDPGVRYRVLARYLNPHCTWTRKSIDQAYQWFHEKRESPPVFPYPRLGLQRPDQINTVNARLMCWMCQTHSIKLGQDETLESMSQKLMCSQMARSTWVDLSPCLFYLLSPEERHGLFLRSLEPVGFEHSAIRSVYEEFGLRLDTLIDCVRIKEWSLCRPVEEWVPSDTALAVLWRKNPLLRNARWTFQPEIPKEYYKPSHLRHLLRHATPQSPDYYESVRYLEEVEPRFRLGWYPTIQNKKTALEQEEVESIDPREIVSYGTRHHLTAYTYDELYNHFNYHQSFLNPASTDLFPVSAIDGLKYLCREDAPYFFGSTAEKRKALYHLIQRISDVLREATPEQRRLYTRVRQDPSYKRSVETSLRAFMELGMTMRGWALPLTDESERQPYPLQEAPVDDQEAVDASIQRAYERFKGSGSASKDIMELPLYSYRGGYLRSKEPSDGLTIAERLQIVFQGERGGIESCVRLSSNWFLSTYSYYCGRTGIPSEFSIEELKMVS